MADPGEIPLVPRPWTGSPPPASRPTQLAKGSASSNVSLSNRAKDEAWMDKVGLLSLATALPPYTVEQPVAKAKARDLFGGRKALFDRLATVFDNAGIAQ